MNLQQIKDLLKATTLLDTSAEWKSNINPPLTKPTPPESRIEGNKNTYNETTADIIIIAFIVLIFGIFIIVGLMINPSVRLFTH